MRSRPPDGCSLRANGHPLDPLDPLDPWALPLSLDSTSPSSATICSKWIVAQFVGGRVYVRTGGSQRHDVIAGLIYDVLSPGVRSARCLLFMANRILVTPAGNAYYPDMFVSCGPGAKRLHEVDASLILEVLSPSTADIDRREKAVAYAQLPGLELYLLVHPDSLRMEAARPQGGTIGSWQTYGAGHVVATLFGGLDIDALHDDLDRRVTVD
ncbi:MAG TPA: Uma2 family endonuclease [Actinomycetota bacterium]|nr:Uma2 family endonuclease [Actinomycetota bacterium]